MVKPLVKYYPCAIANCPAITTQPGARCAVHKVWSNGPHEHPCKLCRKDIVAGELWGIRDGEAVHGACVNRKRRPPKVSAKQARLW